MSPRRSLRLGGTLAGAAALLAAAVPGWGAPRRALGAIAIVTDRSFSIEKGNGAACAAVTETVGQALNQQSLFQEGAPLGVVGHALGHWERPVTLKVWGTADSSQPGTPVSLGSELTFALPEPPFGLPDEEKAVIRSRRVKLFLPQVRDACLAQAKPQKVSPVYSAIRAAVSSLRNACPQTSECLLVIQSDLVETQEPALAAAVAATRKGQPTAQAGLPAPIDLENRISVLLCGYGQGTDVISERGREALLALWQKRVLQNAARFVSQLQCPGYAAGH